MNTRINFMIFPCGHPSEYISPLSMYDFCNRTGTAPSMNHFDENSSMLCHMSSRNSNTGSVVTLLRIISVSYY